LFARPAFLAASRASLFDAVVGGLVIAIRWFGVVGAGSDSDALLARGGVEGASDSSRRSGSAAGLPPAPAPAPVAAPAIALALALALARLQSARFCAGDRCLWLEGYPLELRVELRLLLRREPESGLLRRPPLSMDVGVAGILLLSRF